MQEDELITKLLHFGLTVNQAKVYLSIVQAGTTSVNKISKDTHLHRQDIYKMLPKLEKMGLITKTIDMPFMVNAVPIETSLQDLLLAYRQKTEESINSLEVDVKDLITQVKAKPSEQDETKLSLLTTDKAIKNREDLAFREAQSNLKIILDEETINTSVMRYVFERLQTLLDSGVKINLIIEAEEVNNLVRKIIERIKNTNNRFIIKLAKDVKAKNYQIVDGKELCVATQQKTESGFPCILWTNDANIILIYSEDFAKTWKEAVPVNLFAYAPLQMASIS